MRTATTPPVGRRAYTNVNPPKPLAASLSSRDEPKQQDPRSLQPKAPNAAPEPPPPPAFGSMSALAANAMAGS